MLKSVSSICNDRSMSDSTCQGGSRRSSTSKLHLIHKASSSNPNRFRGCWTEASSVCRSNALMTRSLGRKPDPIFGF